MTKPPAAVLAAVRLADLPEHRREALLWRHALELDYDGVDDLVAERSQLPCRWRWDDCVLAAELTAVAGDDGRYHLCVDGHPLCAPVPSRRRRPAAELPAGTYRHEQWCFWWIGPGGPRLQQPPGPTAPAGKYYHRTCRWPVRLTGTATDPATVPARQRCQESSSLRKWPAHHTTNTQLGRLRIALVTELGRDCHACHQQPGTFVDHDHFTGAVRGLLCRYCNTHVDSCCHPAGCPWADYLNQPPAAGLQLLYPDPNPPTYTTRTRIEYLGFNPLYQPARRPRRPT